MSNLFLFFHQWQVMVTSPLKMVSRYNCEITLETKTCIFSCTIYSYIFISSQPADIYCLYIIISKILR